MKYRAISPTITDASSFTINTRTISGSAHAWATYNNIIKNFFWNFISAPDDKKQTK